MDSGAVSFFTLHTFNVDDVFLSVHLDNFANLLAFVMSTYDLYFIVLADGHRANIVLLPQLLGEGRGHDLSTDM